MKKHILSILFLFLSAFMLQAQLRVWNPQQLNKAKVTPSKVTENIIKEADKNLTQTIASVVDKEKPAPSGDKHDYFSCAPYWWPDPENPNGPYIRRDGERNLDVLTSDKVNLATMTKGIVNLSLAYYFTTDEKYAAKAVENLRIWFLNPATRMNPNLNYGQTISGHFNGKGRGAGMIETYTFVEMLEGVELLKKSPAFTVKDQEALNKWFSEYLNWMLTSEIGNHEYNTKNNHGTAFEVQATRIALFLGKEDIARKFITEFPSRRIFTQIEPDGSQPFELVRTKALHYSIFNLTHVLDMCCIAKTLNIDLYKEKSKDGRCITKAFEFLAQYAGKPQSQFPYQQIAEWDEEQQKLLVQLYRADLFEIKPIFEQYYKQILTNHQIDKYIFLF